MNTDRVAFRLAAADDASFLTEMLAEAAAWQPGATASTEDVLANPFFAHYISGWPRPDDSGVIAHTGDVRVGAAWYRFFDVDDQGFGFVAADIPELTIGVVPTSRHRGIGRVLLRELLRVAAVAGCASVSLSVEPANPARHLYESLGFKHVATTGGAWTMLVATEAAQLAGGSIPSFIPSIRWT